MACRYLCSCHKDTADRETDRQSDTTTVSLKSMRTLGQHSKFCAAVAAASCARTRTPNPNPQFRDRDREPCGLTNETQPNNLVSCTYACAVRLTYRASMPQQLSQTTRRTTRRKHNMQIFVRVATKCECTLGRKLT